MYKKPFLESAVLFNASLTHWSFLLLSCSPQLVPAMFGMFVYKAAALVQVYRDNKDLSFAFPEDEG